MKMEDQKLFINNIAELSDWLEQNHSQSDGIWLVRFKKSNTTQYISYDEIVDQLLCFGWIDSLPRKLDSERTMIRISPRNPKSNWSGINKKRVEELTKKGLMKEPGLKLVEMAKQNGAWNFLDDVEALIIPKDLEQEFEKYEKAAYYFNRFPDSSKRGILEWIKNAKQAATRKKRIEETAQKASENRKANHPAGRDNGPKE